MSDRDRVNDIERRLQDAEGELSRLPVTWPTAGGASAELIGAFAIIKGTVPAAGDITTTGDLVANPQVASPGVLDADATDTTFTAGALQVNPSGTAVIVDGAIVVVDAINPSATDFEAGDGLLMPGALVDEDGTKSFVIAWPDFQGGPGHSTGSKQAWFHRAGNDDYELGGDDC